MSACFCKVVFECILRTPLKFLHKSGLYSLFYKLMIEFGSQKYKNNPSKGNIFFCIWICKQIVSPCGKTEKKPLQEIDINH